MLELFNIALANQDINTLLNYFNLDNDGNITEDEFCNKIVVQNSDWVNPVFVIDRTKYITFIYEAWQEAMQKQRADLQKMIKEICPKTNEVNAKEFLRILERINAEYFSKEVYKYYVNSEDKRVTELNIDEVINIVLDNSLGGYTKEFFRGYVKDLFPFTQFT